MGDGSSATTSSSSGRHGIELPLDAGSAALVGGGGLALSLFLSAAAAYRLARFLRCYEWRLREAAADAFGRKRLGTHLLIVLGALLALPLYALLLASRSDGESVGVCHGLLALHRCQILCALAALALVLSDWRIDVYEAPLLRARRVRLYRLRDRLTLALLALAFLLNLAGPIFCLVVTSKEKSSDDDSGSLSPGEAVVVDASYLMQLACALLLMLSMLHAGWQMKARLLWAARSPLRQHDRLFRTALAQLNALLAVCTASFALQVVTLLFNYIQLALLHRSLLPDAVLWLLGSWLPSLGWSLSALFLARKARRQSFAATAAAAAAVVTRAPSAGHGAPQPSSGATAPLAPGSNDDDTGTLRTLLLDDDGGGGVAVEGGEREEEEAGLWGGGGGGNRRSSGGYRPPPSSSSSS